MLILTTKDFSLENITLTNPESSSGMMTCDINNGDDGVYVQTPKVFFSETTNGVKLFFNNEKKTDSLDVLYGIIKDIEDIVCEKLSGNSSSWFSSEIPLEVIRNNLFKSSIRLPNRISEPLSFIVDVPTLQDGSRDIEVFDSARNSIGYSGLFDSNVKESTFLLHARELKITSNQASISWEIVQVLIHKKKKKIKGFGIRMEEQEETEKIDIGVIKKFMEPEGVLVSENVEEVSENVEEVQDEVLEK